MKITFSIRILSISILLIAFGIFSVNAALLTGSMTPIPGSTTYDLTALGELDWAYWNSNSNTTSSSASPTNRKSGGSLISNASPYSFGTLVRSSSSTNTTSDFSYSLDGSSPASGTASNVSGVFNATLGPELSGPQPGVTFTIALPMAGTTYGIQIWGAQYYTQDAVDSGVTSEDSDGLGGIFTASLSGATSFTNNAFVAGNEKPSALYQISATPDNNGDLLTLTYVLNADAISGNAHVIFNGAAISAAAVIPEPSVFIMLGGFGLLLLISRLIRP